MLYLYVIYIIMYMHLYQTLVNKYSYTILVIRVGNTKLFWNKQQFIAIRNNNKKIINSAYIIAITKWVNSSIWFPGSEI